MRAKLELLTAVEVADLFGIPVWTVRRMTAAGAMAASRRAKQDPEHRHHVSIEGGAVYQQVRQLVRRPPDFSTGDRTSHGYLRCRRKEK